MVVDALILAGGRARRFGGVVKPLLEVDGRTVLDRQLDVLRPRVREVWLSANDPAPFAGLGLPLVADEQPGLGPLGGILAGLRASDADWMLVVAGDMPHLMGAVVDELLDAAGASGSEVQLVIPDLAQTREPDPARAPGGERSGGEARSRPALEPLHAVYHRAAATVIADRIAAGRRKAMDLAKALPTRRIGRERLLELDPSLRFRANLNSPADLVEG